MIPASSGFRCLMYLEFYSNLYSEDGKLISYRLLDKLIHIFEVHISGLIIEVVSHGDYQVIGSVSPTHFFYKIQEICNLKEVF